ncbi:MAG: CusA/CzcA family heavy metal efflux RND transporter [Luteolibacter sp.]
MLSNLIQFSIRHRWLVILATLAIGALGVYNFNRLPIDAVPDITNVQVQINTSAPGYSPFETEQRITYPIETAMAGIPFLDRTRSISRYALSQVTVNFDEGTDIYWARQQITERLSQIKGQLPPGVEPDMGPISTGLGEIYMYSVEAEKDARKPDGTPYTPSDLRTIHDWTVKSQLRNVEGVSEVNVIGGFVRQFHVQPEPAKLIAYNLSLEDIVGALSRNNQNTGAGFIEKNGEQFIVRSPGQVRNLEDISAIVVASRDGIPVRIRDVADVVLGEELRSGAGTLNGEEVVIGTTMMLIGENSRTVSKRVHDKVDVINDSLPKGVHLKTIYNRTTLVDATIGTIRKNLMEGAILVIVILFLLLGNIRAAIIAAAIIPLSMLFTITGMVGNKISGNLMSLGALDFGIIVDGAVIIVENCIRCLAEAQHEHARILAPRERFPVVYRATKQVVVPSLFGSLIIMVVYLPIFALTGVEGKMFHPMAFTVVLALVGAMIFSVTFVPALVAVLLRGKISEKENFAIRGAKSLYAPLLRAALEHRLFVIAAAAILLVLSGLLASRMGSEFIPSLDEGDIAMEAVRIPSTGITQSLEMQKQMERKMLELPEVDKAFSRTGSAEIATDPMPANTSDGYVMLKPRSQWPDPNMKKAELIERVEKTAHSLLGTNYEISQPIQLRFNELISGVRSDLGIMIFGDDTDVLLATGTKVSALVHQIPGAADVKVEQASGLPMLTVEIDRVAISRYGLDIATVQEAVEIAIGGKEAGTVYEGDIRSPLIVRLPEHIRKDLDAIRRLPIPVKEPVHMAESKGESANPPSPGFVTLGSVAELKLTTGPNLISRENGKRRIIVSANVRGRDLGSFVTEVQEKIKNSKLVPTGYWVEYGGQFEQLMSASKRLQLVIPIALFLILILLFMTFGSVKDALLVFSGVPLALTGGIAALWIRDIPLSISAGVGFIALSGVAVLNGLVMVSFIKSLRKEGKELLPAVIEGSVLRLRPVLMTAAVAAFGFVPMALAHGRGAEVQKPLATVVIGGIITSTVLTLFVLPVLYAVFHRKGMEKFGSEDIDFDELPDPP